MQMTFLTFSSLRQDLTVQGQDGVHDFRVPLVLDSGEPAGHVLLLVVDHDGRVLLLAHQAVHVILAFPSRRGLEQHRLDGRDLAGIEGAEVGRGLVVVLAVVRDADLGRRAAVVAGGAEEPKVGSADLGR